ncbi:DUF6578 domain-containing protein [Microbacterium enclense]|uniref:DUF6578 domain-containing protein n=1 Tax=Microbacterium enclense TaxID=993073 RepID=UPI0036D82198
MTRAWLEAGDWACCGDPFVVGDEVDFVIGGRSLPTAFARDLGEGLASTIDALEARHPETTTGDHIRGRVMGVHVVTQEYAHRFSLRRPGRGAPADAEMPADGEPWPFEGVEMASGLVLGSRPTRWMVAIEPVPGVVSVVPVDAVPGEPTVAAELDDLDGPEPPLRRVWARAGWVVDVDEGDSFRATA